LIQQIGGASELYTDAHYAGAGYSTVVVADKKGGLHLLWGEPPDSTATTNRMAEVTTLYYSHYSEGNWSTREQVYHYPPGFSWGGYLLKHFVVDDEDNLHLAFTNYNTWERAGTIQYLRKDQEGWHVRDTELEAGEGFIEVGPDGEILLTYIAAQLPENAKRGDSDQNSIFFTVSTDDGITWAEPVLVNRSGRQPGNAPRIVLAPDETIHVLWFKALEGQWRSQVIWHANSNDGGQTWSEPAEIGTGLGGHLTMFQAVATQDGCIHMVIEREGGIVAMDQQLYYSQWDGNRWSQPERPFPDTYSLQFGMTASDDGNVHLTWTQRPSAAWPSRAAALPGPGEWPRQAYSINRPR